MHPGIKLRHLRAFLLIAQEGSITAAARRLGVAQPSLSKTLAELQALLGTDLFEREGRGIALSPKGEVFRRHALGGMQLLEEGAAAIDPGRGDPGLSVGVLPTVAGRVFPEAALEFMRRRPSCRLRVQTGSHAVLLSQLREGLIDLMVGRMPHADEMSGLAFDWLYDEEIVLVCRTGHPGRDRPVDRLVADSQLILPPAGAIIRRPVDEYLLAIGASEPDVRLETVSLPLARGILENSDLLWFISLGVVEREVRANSLSVIPIGASYLSGAVGITTKNAATRRSMIVELAAVLHQMA